jgi:uncharacterized YigZ family protein
METTFFTLKAGAAPTFELVEKKSRFIAQLFLVATEEEATAAIAAVRAHYHDARHHVYAYVLQDGTERASDDGEPSRTSGPPTLEALHAAGLANVLCVTTRYFGGTLLGPGGLKRAYAGAATGAIEAAAAAGELAHMELMVGVVCDATYAAYDTLAHLAQSMGATPGEVDFGERVRATYYVAAGTQDQLLAAITAKLYGHVTTSITEEVYLAV